MVDRCWRCAKCWREVEVKPVSGGGEFDAGERGSRWNRELTLESCLGVAIRLR